MFEGLTKYIPDLENKETGERRLSKIEDEVYGFIHNHPESGLKYYWNILKSQGVNIENTPLSQVDPAGLSGLGVMALLAAAVSEERREPFEVAGTAQEIRRQSLIQRCTHSGAGRTQLL